MAPLDEEKLEGIAWSAEKPVPEHEFSTRFKPDWLASHSRYACPECASEDIFTIPFRESEPVLLYQGKKAEKMDGASHEITLPHAYQHSEYVDKHGKPVKSNHTDLDEALFCSSCSHEAPGWEFIELAAFKSMLGLISAATGKSYNVKGEVQYIQEQQAAASSEG